MFPTGAISKAYSCHIIPALIVRLKYNLKTAAMKVKENIRAILPSSGIGYGCAMV